MLPSKESLSWFQFRYILFLFLHTNKIFFLLSKVIKVKRKKVLKMCLHLVYRQTIEQEDFPLQPFFLLSFSIKDNITRLLSVSNGESDSQSWYRSANPKDYIKFSPESSSPTHTIPTQHIGHLISSPTNYTQTTKRTRTKGHYNTVIQFSFFNNSRKLSTSSSVSHSLYLLCVLFCCWPFIFICTTLMLYSIKIYMNWMDDVLCSVCNT